MKKFRQLLVNTFLVSTKNNFVWFALTYWVYLETRSVVSTSIIGGGYLVAAAISNMWFGSLVDHYRKKLVMLGSNVATFACFILGFWVYVSAPAGAFTSVTSPTLWLFILFLIGGVIAGSIYAIAVPTLVTVLVPEKTRDRANGMLGMVMGISFSATSFASGLTLGFLGMAWVLGIAIVATIVGMMHLLSIRIGEKKIIHVANKSVGKMDIKGTIAAIKAVPGLFALIFFTTFNNFLGGVFMALMDAYGLTLVSVQAWGVMWGFLSFGFILGGLFIAKKGLGKNPLATLFRINLVTWTVCIFFTIQPSVILLAVGIFIWMCLMPFVEAVEQTIIQKVVPPERQGRVFGFAHSVEQAASPLTAFLIGPIAQFIFIPFMTTGAGVGLIGDWYGVGVGRGIALVFTIAGTIGLAVTLIAMHSRPYKLLSARFQKPSS